MKALLTYSGARLLAALTTLALAGIIAWFSLVPATEAPAPQLSDKLKHFVAYAALAAPWTVALGPGLSRMGAALAFTSLYGAGLEVAQMMGNAGREGSLLDIAANLSGALTGLALASLLRGDWALFGGNRG